MRYPDYFEEFEEKEFIHPDDYPDLDLGHDLMKDLVNVIYKKHSSSIEGIYYFMTTKLEKIESVLRKMQPNCACEDIQKLIFAKDEITSLFTDINKIVMYFDHILDSLEDAAGFLDVNIPAHNPLTHKAHNAIEPSRYCFSNSRVRPLFPEKPA